MAATADSLDGTGKRRSRDIAAPETSCSSPARPHRPAALRRGLPAPSTAPPDEAIYLDVAFFDTLSSDYGASEGSLSQMYVLAHEWGHHISNLIGTLQKTGRETGAASGSVRLELQADCFAGAWVKDASAVTDDAGVPLLQPVTAAQIDDAMSAAASVGDDHIMESAGVEVNTERFTHGTSEQRQRWFQEGYRGGPGTCDTFAVAASEL